MASVLSRLKVFLATREDAWRYRGQMTLVVGGFNHDPRELVDIPQVRTLLRRLEAEWPYWASFFNQVDDSIKLLLDDEDIAVMASPATASALDFVMKLPRIHGHLAL